MLGGKLELNGVVVLLSEDIDAICDIPCPVL